MRPLGGPWSLCSRMGIRASCQILEDIDMYKRVHDMQNRFSATDSRENDGGEDMPNSWETQFVESDTLHKKLRGIPSTQSMNPMFKPLSGIIKQRHIYQSKYAMSN